MVAIKAAFADWRPVKSRGVLQLVLEVPVEMTEHVLKTLGPPIPGIEKWVGVALLNPEAPIPGSAKVQSVLTDGPPVAPRATEASGLASGRSYTLANRIGMRCNDAAFQEWALRFAVTLSWSIGEPDCAGADREGVAASIVRKWCGVETRAQIIPGTEAAAKWLTMETQFLADSGSMAEQRG